MSIIKRISIKLKAGIGALDERFEKRSNYRLVKRTFKEFGKDEIGDRSAAIAYFAVLSIFPLLLGLVSLLGFFLPAGTVRETVSNALGDVLPSSSSLIETNLDNIVEFRGLGAIISVALLLWSGSNLFAAIGRAVNRAWGIHRDRPFIKKKVLHLSMVVATGLMLLASLGITTAVDIIRGFDGSIINWFLRASSYIVSFILVFVVLLLIYKTLPNLKTTWKMVWPGALAAAVLFELAKQGFIWYLAKFADYSRIYGSLASLIVLIFWIYLSAVIVLLGVELTAELYQMRTGKKIDKSQAVLP